MAIDGILNNARRIGVATYEHFEACVDRVPEPARSELRRLAGDLAKAERLAVATKVIMLLAHDLGIRDTPTLVRINNATGLGGIHSTMLDHIVDNKGVGDRAAIQNVYLSHVVFNFYYDAWSRIREQPPTFAEIEEFTGFEIETYAALFDEEARHVGVSSPFESQRTVAAKCAPVKAVILQMFRLTGREDLKDRIFSAVEECSFALLLGDDIEDWEQDFDLRRFTYPLQAAFERLDLVYDPTRHECLKQKVARTLFLTGLYNELMKDIADRFASTANDLAPVCPSLAAWLGELTEKARKTWRRHARFVYEKATVAGATRRAAAG
jgi:hypothetical protein